MTKDELATVVTYTAAAWPNLAVSDTVFDVWFDLLGDLDGAAVLAVVKELALQGRAFAPGPGEVRTRLFQHLSGEPDLDEAWGQLQAEITRTGYYGQPSFDSGALTEWVKHFGWQQACAEDLMILRAHFYKTYGTTKGRSERAAAIPPNVAAVLEGVGKRAPELSEVERPEREPKEL